MYLKRRCEERFCAVEVREITLLVFGHAQVFLTGLRLVVIASKNKVTKLVK